MVPSESSSSDDEELPHESQPLLTNKTSSPVVHIATNEVEEVDDSQDVESDHDNSDSEKIRRGSSGDSDDDVSQLFYVLS